MPLICDDETTITPVMFWMLFLSLSQIQFFLHSSFEELLAKELLSIVLQLSHKAIKVLCSN